MQALYKQFRSSILLYLLMCTAFLTYSINLNYNSPFNDEAVYIVVGKLGLFEWDWTTYNAKAWMAGLPFIYPVITAAAHSIGGISASRFINILFAIGSLYVVYDITLKLTKGDSNTKKFAGFVAAALVAGSGVSYYVSRLATYDMPSFFFLFVSLSFILKAGGTYKNGPKYYILSVIFLMLSLGTKITAGLYLPLFVSYSYFSIRKNKRKLKIWKNYFILPLIAVFMIWLISIISSLITFYTTQTGRETAELDRIINVFLDNTLFIWPFWFLSTLVILFRKQWKLWLALTISFSLILVFHFGTQRVPTLDKHAYISLVFIAITSGIGISYFISYFKNKKRVYSFLKGITFGLLIFYWLISYQSAQEYNHLWRNASGVLNFVNDYVEPNDKVLTEIGAATLLAAYPNNHPINTTTFDWFIYDDITGEDAYANAVRDGYFDLIILEGDQHPKSEINRKLNNSVAMNMFSNYRIIFDDDGYYVFERNY